MGVLGHCRALAELHFDFARSSGPSQSAQDYRAQEIAAVEGPAHRCSQSASTPGKGCALRRPPTTRSSMTRQTVGWQPDSTPRWRMPLLSRLTLRGRRQRAHTTHLRSRRRARDVAHEPPDTRGSGRVPGSATQERGSHLRTPDPTETDPRRDTPCTLCKNVNKRTL